MKRTIQYMLLIAFIPFLFSACSRNIQIRTVSKLNHTVAVTPTPLPTSSVPKEAGADTDTPGVTLTPHPTSAPVSEGAEELEAIFMYNNGVYLLKNMTVSRILENVGSGLTVSPDSSKIATILRSDDLDMAFVFVHSSDGKIISQIKVAFEYDSLEWADNETVLARAHIGPNTAGYLFYNIKDNSVKEFYGNGLTVISGAEHYAYFGNAPLQYNYYLYINDKAVYKTDDVKTVIADYAFSPDGDEAAILEKDLDSDRLLLKVFAYDKDNVELKLTNFCEIVLSFNSESIYYGPEDELRIEFDRYVYSFDRDNDSVKNTGEYVSDMPYLPPELQVRNNVLQDIVTKQLGNVFDSVLYINWLS